MSGSVSLVNGHIDSDKNEMTPQEALAWVEDYEKAIKEEQAIVNNGDEFHVEALKVCEVVKRALEKQIPKKPMTQFEKLKQMNTDEAATFISALADSCKDVARYGNQTVPYLVKLLLECEVEEE